ncbi:chromosome segregation protein SMC [Corynebacterium sp. sy017]|uniref:chromosome segregation protein SMC n=1 Tax=unclassified Corynebacterium TaxID=2624378 RepID=UPI0011855B1A|nr:chromosome segregation protein SMC [Corynebacterium sp. SY003]MBP3087879.1 chromosome segregation protein SMC [Corynebacterium sp. sy017]TSD92420.1 chromosome segregation protein SMC [Corynebacterium sp. SY003]
MYLKSLTLKGFKSFASATTLKFEPGICAVVGPNGSGKSNVVDALAWVMGEQGVKTLRGGKMEDVIFAGAGQRKPLGRAEVTLAIDNSDGALPIEYREVAVTRRMFRDGASEYEINGTKARLMDIQELLSDSGIGREMHVIVGQGRLNQILESRPEERRAFIEEAAGVLKHKRRKEKAQRKLVSMQANVDRLNDLTQELRRQLKPLARQAKAAQRAASVQAQVRQARLQLAGYELAQLAAAHEDIQKQVHAAQEQSELVAEQLEQAHILHAEAEQEVARATPAAEQAQQLWFQLSALAERVAATQRIARERADNFVELSYQGQDPDVLARQAERVKSECAQLDENVEIARQRLENIQEEVSDYELRAQEADKEHMAQVRAIADRREGVVRLVAAQEKYNEQLKVVAAEIARYNEQLEHSRSRSQDIEKRLLESEQAWVQAQDAAQPLQEAHIQATAEADAAEKRLEQLRAEQKNLEKQVSRLESRIETLQAAAPRAHTSYAGSSESKAAMAELVPLANKMKMRAEYAGQAKALAAALGFFAEALAGAIDDETLAQLVSQPGNVTTIARQTPGDTPWRLDADLPAQTQWLLDALTIDSGYVVAVTRLLADVVLVPNLDLAMEVINNDPRLRAVTYDGQLIGQGWVQFGQGAISTLEVEAQVEAAQSELEVVQAQLAEIAGTFSGAQTAAQEARVAVAQATANMRDHNNLIAQLERDVQRLRGEKATLQAEHEKLADHAQAADIRQVEVQKHLDDTLDRLARVDSDETQDQELSTHQRDEAFAALSQIKAMELEAKLALRSSEDKVRTAYDRLRGLERQINYERQAKAQFEQQMVRKRQQAQLAQWVSDKATVLGQQLSEVLEQAQRDREDKAQQRAHWSTRLQETKSAHSALQAQHKRLSDNVHALELASTQASVRLEEARTKIFEQLGVPVEEIARDYLPDSDFDEKTVREELREAEKDLNALGKVNPLALEEYKALEERYDFLANQLADLERARQDLSDVIEGVDKKILQLFHDAWLDVEKEFPKVFSTLFPGGQGRLVLTDPQDILGTGIEVEARPPGKKVKRLSLLSGGEKSLTALAMLVAIFRARPSPFYVMDEVEAALDDVNLRRLIALFEQLRQDSQLIVITHQKPTMDIANVLYGVTMRGDGVTRVISQRMSPELRQSQTQQSQPEQQINEED